MASLDFLAARREGLATCWTTTVHTSPAAGTALLVRNIQAKYNLHVERIFYFASTNAAIVIHCPTDSATALAGTAVSGVAFKRSSANTTNAEAKSTETGLTQGTILQRDYVVANTTREYPFEGSIVLGNGVSIGLDTVHEAQDCVVTFWTYFKAV